MNRVVEPGLSPHRVVSLVPSMTDSMIALGLESNLVGVTDDFQAAENLAGLRRVGGAKDSCAEEIVGLHPDMVFANAEENPESLIDALEQSGLKVWVTFPKTVRQAVLDLRDLAMLYASETALQSVVWLDRAVDWLEGARAEKSVRVFCPRSREGPAENPLGWETFNGDTYAGSLLSLCGAENVFTDKVAGRYPVVTPEEVIAMDPEVILLPGDPFPFSEADKMGMLRCFADVPAVQNGRVWVVDGRWIFWPGTKLGEAIRSLPELFRDRE
jgi:ABC-type Fe3+-hydroxamate transport system substrate-binding protein